MKLYKVEVTFKNRKRGRSGVDVIVHASSKAATRRFLAGKYAGATLGEIHALPATATKHFVLADLTD